MNTTKLQKGKKSRPESEKPELIEMDAQDRPVGRIAAEIAVYLQGKHRPDYAPHKPGQTVVEVKNAGSVKLTGRKWSDKIYYRHSGYLGSLKQVTASEMQQKKPEEILRLAVWGMLPKNRLRKVWIKRLKFVENG